MSELRSKYMSYVTSCTDAPAMYSEGLFDMIVGLFMGRRFAVEFGPKRIYPNRWVLLIGASGYGKNTAIEIARDMVSGVDMSLVGTDSTTVQQMWRAFAERPLGAMFLEEMAAFIKEARQHYNEGMIETLTDFYDCPPYKVRRLSPKDGREQVFEVRDPFLSMCGGVTPNWLNEVMRQQDVGGGFWARWEPYVAKKKEREYEFPPPADKALFRELVGAFGVVRDANTNRLGGEHPPTRVYKCASTGQSRYSAWLKSARARYSKNEVWAGAYKRAEISLLKSALVHAFLSGDSEITAYHVEQAARTMDHVIDGINELANTVSHSKFEHARQRVIDLIRSAGAVGMPRHELVWLAKMSPSELGPVLQHLREAGKIEERDPDGEHVVLWVGE